MMIKRAHLNACLVMLGCLAGDAWAAPISYSADGFGGADLLSNSGFAPTNLGILDIGTNTVSGGLYEACIGSCTPNPDGVDAFSVDLPVGLQITALSFAVSNFGARDSTGRAYDFDSYAPLSVDFPFSDNGLFSLSGLSASGPGQLVFVATGEFIGNDTSNYGLTYEYTWSITVAGAPVSQVPEPGTLGLLGVALAGVALMRRARRR